MLWGQTPAMKNGFPFSPSIKWRLSWRILSLGKTQSGAPPALVALTELPQLSALLIRASNNEVCRREATTPAAAKITSMIAHLARWWLVGMDPNTTTEWYGRTACSDTACRRTRKTKR